MSVYRRLVWEDNVNYIQKHNLAADRGEHTYWLGQNEYADMVSMSFWTRSHLVELKTHYFKMKISLFNKAKTPLLPRAK